MRLYVHAGCYSSEDNHLRWLFMSSHWLFNSPPSLQLANDEVIKAMNTLSSSNLRAMVQRVEEDPDSD